VPEAQSEQVLVTVARWLDENAPRLKLVQVRRDVIANPAKLHAGYEVASFLVSVTAWERGACLDIDVLDKNNGKIAMIGQGECAGTSGVLERLDAFSRWLADHGAASN
jgi:hypothetical protein